MKDSKLITLLRAFSPDEFKALEAFLQSPYFNPSAKLIKLFNLIKPHYPRFESDKLEKEKMHKTLHGKSKKPGGKIAYSDSTMRELISEMYKQAKAFLAFDGLRKNNLEQGAIRYKWYFEHNFHNLAEEELESRKLQLDSFAPHHIEYYRHQWLSRLHQFEMTASRFKGREHKLLTGFDLFEHADALNRQYLANSFMVYTYLLAMARIYNFKIETGRLDKITALAHNYVNKGDIVIDIFFNIFQLAHTNEEQYFYDLKAKFLLNDRVVSQAVMLEAGVALENYCIKKLRDGNEQFAHEAMQIYRFEIDHGLIMDGGKLNHMFYVNIASLGTETGDIEWADYFIETYKKFLPDERREDCYNFAKAYILFARKNYREALRLALSCQMTFIVTKIQIRNLVARAQYELGMLDELLVELHAHLHHIKDEKLTEDRQQHYETFITIMRQLAALKGNYNHGKLMSLDQLVDSQKGFANRGWVKEKIRELIR